MNSREKFVVGIDQGGTKTHICIANMKGEIVKSTIKEGSWLSLETVDEILNKIICGFEEMIKSINITLEDIEIVVAGIAGVDFVSEKIAFENIMKKYFVHNKIIVVNDAVVALKSGLTLKNGVILCAGTGSNCAAVNSKGEINIFGYYIDDYLQGATGIGNTAIRAVFDNECGIGKPTMLTSKILEFYKIDDVDTLLEQYITNREIQNNIKYITPFVFECADEKDEISIDILTKFGEEISKFVYAGAKKLNITNEKIEVVITGGVFTRKNNIITETLKHELDKKSLDYTIVEPIYEPVLGALYMGYEEIGVNIDDTIKSNIQKTVEENNLIRRRS